MIETFQDYLERAKRAAENNRELRLGQVYANVLSDCHLELYKRIRIVGYDPFYKNENIPKFLTFCEQEW